LAQAIFQPNLYKYPSDLIPVILPAYTTYGDGTDRVVQLQHIQFRPHRITQNKKYNIIQFVKNITRGNTDTDMGITFVG
jgi:hypothetical protein